MASTAELVTDSTDPGSKTFKSRLSYIRQVITVEPLVAAYIMASLICLPGLSQLNWEKACRSNLALNDTICNGIIYEKKNYPERKNIQIELVKVQAWQSIIEKVVPLILVLFLGSYSDRHQIRKPFLLVPILGEFLAVAGCLLSVFFMKEWSLQVLAIVQTVVPSFLGGPPMLKMAAFAYIADVSTPEMRILRVALVPIIINGCGLVAEAISGPLHQKLGYYGVLCIAIACYVFAVGYGIFCIKEPKKPTQTTKINFLADICNPDNAKQTVSLLFKKGKGRGFLVVLLSIFLVYMLVLDGEASLFFSYTKDNFSWSSQDFGFYKTSATAIHLVGKYQEYHSSKAINLLLTGTIVGLPLLTKYLEMGDMMILSVTFVDKIGANIVYALARSTEMLYLAAAVNIISGISFVAITSAATKIVAPEDIGKAQSLLAICGALGGALAGPVYSAGIYRYTLTSSPSLYFYVGVILVTGCTLVALWLHFKTKSALEADSVPKGESYCNVAEDLQMKDI